MKNRKAFTMIELIVVIIIIGVILVFAIPNIVATLERNKKEAMAISAKNFIEMTRDCIVEKRKLATKTCAYPNTSATYYLKEIDINKQIKESTTGDQYDRDNSTVTVTKTTDASGSTVYDYEAILRLKDSSETCTMHYGDDKCSS